MKTRWVTSHVIARMIGRCQRSVRLYCVHGVIPPEHVRRTAGGHLRIDLEAARRLKPIIENRKDHLAVKEDFK